ncbi:hypothetical protein GCM10023318_53720 [Nocardia callitridis]|uniref:Uncharacterized protein n=1 Tax=Nocardia callitridis TaxID=648753 RepID=A0ABP9KWJ8_9NOCA
MFGPGVRTMPSAAAITPSTADVAIMGLIFGARSSLVAVHWAAAGPVSAAVDCDLEYPVSPERRSDFDRTDVVSVCSGTMGRSRYKEGL